MPTLFSFPNSRLGTRLCETPVSRPTRGPDAKQKFRGVGSPTGVWEQGNKGTRENRMRWECAVPLGSQLIERGPAAVLSMD